MSPRPLSRIPSGLRPLTKAERRRLARENDRALFPSIVVQRLLATCDALEQLRAQRVQSPSPSVPEIQEKT